MTIDNQKKIIPIRFLIDEHFILNLLKDRVLAINIIFLLSKIHSNSKHYELEHNVMFDESFKNSIKDKTVRGGALLGAIHPVACPDFLLKETDFHCKIIKYAINLATKTPYKVAILTSKEEIQNFLISEHYKDENVRSAIKILYGQEAFDLIKLVNNLTFSN